MCCPDSTMSSDAVVSPQKRGSYKQAYSKADILAALSDYEQGRRALHPVTFQQVAAAHGVPASTVRDYHRRSRAAVASSPRYSVPSAVIESSVMSTSSGGRHRLLSDDVESKMKAWIDMCGDLLQPPTVTLLRLKAQRLYFAAHGIAVNEENDTQLASLKWWRGFKKRYPTVSVRRPIPLEMARARATQPEIINHFYDLLEHQLTTHGFTPDQIYAADETGIAGDQKVGKAVGDKGKYTHTPRLVHR
jgi:hypothetical protein